MGKDKGDKTPKDKSAKKEKKEKTPKDKSAKKEKAAAEEQAASPVVVATKVALAPIAKPLADDKLAKKVGAAG